MASKPKKRQKPTQTSDPSDRQVASQPSIRTAILWDPMLLRSVAIQADSGDLFRLGELCEQMIADDRIGELLESLASDVLGEELSFEETPNGTAGDAEKSDELSSDWATGYDDDELTSLTIWTLITGVGFSKHQRWLDHESRVVPELKWWHPRHFAYKTPDKPLTPFERRWHVRDNDGRMSPIEPGDGTWVILTRRGEYRPWANGLWRGLSPWWLLKQYAIQDWGVHSEKASKLVATAQDTTTAEQRKSLARYIYEASKDAVISLPPGFDLKLIELAADTEAIYNAQINAANEAFAIAILGQNLSSNVQGGSRAAAEVHERKENRKVKYVGKMLAKGLREQSVCWWAEYNFGDRELAPYLHWHTEPPEDYAAKATGLKTLGDALVALKAAGYKLPTDDIEEDYGVELEELPEPVLPPMPVGGAPIPGKPAVPGKPLPKQPPVPTKKPAKAFLASGDSADAAPGFIAGQVYVDDLSDKEAELAADYMGGFVDRLMAAIDECEDYESVRSAVLKAFADEEDPERLAELVEHGMLLANLAGRHAVEEDVPEVKAKGSAEHVAELAALLLQSSVDVDADTLRARLKAQPDNPIAQAATEMLGQLNS